MFVEVFMKLGEVRFFNSRYLQGNHNYLIRVADYMTLKYFPLIKISSGEDP